MDIQDRVRDSNSASGVPEAAGAKNRKPLPLTSTTRFQDRRKESEGRRKALLKRMTPAEKRFRVIAKEMGIRSYPQAVFFLDQSHYRIVDFYLPKPYRICIELDGSSHDNQETQRYDRWKDRKLATTHRLFRIVRFQNEEVFEEGFKDKLTQALHRYYIKPHHLKRVKPKWKHRKPSVTGKKILDLRRSLSCRSQNVDRRHTLHYPGLTMQPGYTLAELRKMGIL